MGRNVSKLKERGKENKGNQSLKCKRTYPRRQVAAPSMARKVVAPEDTKELKLRLLPPSSFLILLCASTAVMAQSARKGIAHASSLDVCSSCSSHSPVSAAAGERSVRACTVSASNPGTITPTEAQFANT